MDNQKAVMQKSVSLLLTSICLSVLQFSSTNSCAGGNVTVTNVPSLGGDNLDVYAMNSTGQLTGFSFLAGNNSAHAFLYRNGLPTDLGGLGGSVSEGFGINSAGLVVGDSNISDDSQTHEIGRASCRERVSFLV